VKLTPLRQWICDSCGKLIEKPEDGWWEYLHDTETGLISGFRIVHYGGPCYYNEQALRHKNKLVGDMHLDQVLKSGGFGHMLHWLELSETRKINERIEITDFTEIMRRLYLPYWEEARLYWEQAYKDGFHDKCSFDEEMLLSIISEYGKDEEAISGQ
jgi:hypothetical protein